MITSGMQGICPLLSRRSINGLLLCAGCIVPTGHAHRCCHCLQATMAVCDLAVPCPACRFTVDGARSLLSSAGFRIEDAWTGGDPLTANAFMMGFGQHDFANEEVADNAALHELAVTHLPHLPGDGAYLSSVIIASATAKSAPKGALQAAKHLHSRVVRPGL